MSRKIAIIGKQGQLAQSLRKNQGTLTCVEYLGHTDIDLQSVPALIATLKDVELVINTAAYTDVERAESESEAAWRLNATAVENLVSAGLTNGFRLIHLSTDYVFDGQHSTPWQLSDTPAPISVYGNSKLAGEKAVLSSPIEACVIRTAWLYSEIGHNFVNTMLGLMAQRSELNIVCDQRGAPTYAGHLAQFIWALSHQTSMPRLVHFTNTGQASWYEFACEIQQQATAIGLINSDCQLRPIAAIDYPTRAKRPAYSVLDLSDTPQCGPSISWQTALQEMLKAKKSLESNLT